MNKRERLEHCFAGEATDRVPVALWRHWPGDDQRAADLAAACVSFQNSFDWDFIKVTPSSNYAVTDYGVQDRWAGNLEGTREITRHYVQRSLDWTEIRPLDPNRGSMGRQLECLQLIPDGLDDPQTPILMTIMSPLAQARQLGGDVQLLRHMRTQADRLHTALNTLTESTLRFMDALSRCSIAGIFFVIQHASYDLMSVEEYNQFGLPYDRKIFDALRSSWWFNILHFHGPAPMFHIATQFNVQAVNWQDYQNGPDLALGRSQITGAACGGLSQGEHLHQGTPNAVREAAREALQLTNARRFILAAGGAAMISTPLSNLRTVREAVSVAGV